MKEVWKKIKGFPTYQVSNKGRVKSLPKKKGFGKGYVQKERILKAAPTTSGYPAVILVKNNKKYGKEIHRLVYDAFGKGKKNTDVVDHIDRNRANNKISNLRPLTNQQNVKRAFTERKIMKKTELIQMIKEEIDTVIKEVNRKKYRDLGFTEEEIDDLIAKDESCKKDKVDELKKNALHNRLGISVDKKIPITLINKEISKLHKKQKDGKKLSASESKFLKQLTFAKNVK